jgi:Ca-activated chloride channel family protein
MWAHPQYLPLGLAIPLLLALAWLFERRRLRDMIRWADRAFWTRYGIPLRLSPTRLFFLGIALLSAWIALLGPLGPPRMQSVRQRAPDIVLALDLSLSMYAPDGTPTRLEQARQSAQALLQALPEARWGLVTFAGTAFPHCPLVTDPEPVQLLLSVADPSWMPVQGTDLGAALDRARELFPPNEGIRARAIVLITDGEDHENRFGSALQELRRLRIPVFVLGVGGSQPVAIPLPAGEGQPRYKLDRAGQVVRTRLEEDRLRGLAEQTGGRYYHAAQLPELLRHLRQLPAQSETQRARYEREPLYRPFLLLSLLGWLGYWYGSGWRTLSMALLILVWGLGPGSELRAQAVVPGEDRRAVADFRAALEAYQTGRFREAAELFVRASRRFRIPENQALSLYNAGGASYRAGAPDAALKAYREALARYPDEETRKRYEWLWRRIRTPVPRPEHGSGTPLSRPAGPEGPGFSAKPPEGIDQVTAESVLQRLRAYEARVLDRLHRRLPPPPTGQREKDW